MLEARDGVRVARQHDLHAPVAGEPGVRVVQVAPVRLTVDFQGHAEARRLRDHGLHVESGGLTAEEHPSSRMSEDVDVRAFERAQYAIGHPIGLLRER